MSGILLLFLLFTSLGPCWPVCVDLLKSVQNNLAMHHHAYHRFYTTATSMYEEFLQCAQECMTSTKCQSLNFVNSTGECVLNVEDSTSASMEMTASVVAMYLDKSAWPFNVSGVCKDLVCPVNQKCDGQSCVPDHGHCPSPDVHTGMVNSVEGRYDGAISVSSCKEDRRPYETWTCVDGEWTFVDVACYESFENHTINDLFEKCAICSSPKSACIVFVNNSTIRCVESHADCFSFSSSSDRVISQSQGLYNGATVITSCQNELEFCATRTCLQTGWSLLDWGCHQSLWTNPTNNNIWTYQSPCLFTEGWKVKVIGRLTGNFEINLKSSDIFLLHVNVRMADKTIVFDTKTTVWENGETLIPDVYPFKAVETFIVSVVHMGEYYKISVKHTDVEYDFIDRYSGLFADKVSVLGNVEVDQLRITGPKRELH